MDLLTLGETMVLMDPVEPGPMAAVDRFRKRVGGAESNVAVALSRLGHDAAWLSRLGDDPHGRFVRDRVRGEGVETRVTFDPEAPTGVMFKERREAGDPRVFYYRDGSAASRLSPDDVDEVDAGWLHVTGITPALSRGAREATVATVDAAKDAGAKVSFDPNLRHRLWSVDQMRETLLPLAARADLVLPGVEEGETLLDTDDPEAIAREFCERGAGTVAVKLGADGALVACDDGTERVPGFEVPVVDTVGAGDGFAAGFLSGLLDGLDPFAAAERANAVGAHAVTVTGDTEGYPRREELEAFLDGDRTTR